MADERDGENSICKHLVQRKMKIYVVQILQQIDLQQGFPITMLLAPSSSSTKIKANDDLRQKHLLTRPVVWFQLGTTHRSVRKQQNMDWCEKHSLGKVGWGRNFLLMMISHTNRQSMSEFIRQNNITQTAPTSVSNRR